MANTTIPYDEPIDKNTDWGGDSSTGGRPVAGGRVQDFIKGSLQELDDRITNISGLGRFLSGWDCTTGLAVTDPKTDNYEYPDGSFFIVAKVGDTNLRPSGDRYVIGQASTAQETGNVKVGDIYKYDGSAWMLINLDTPEIPAFSDEVPGTIRGKDADGYVTAEDGYGKVKGWKVSTVTENGIMSASDKAKLDGIAAGAEVNVQADWNVTDVSSDAFIKNKPTSLPANGGTAETISKTLPISKGGTGQTSAISAANILIDSLGEGTQTPIDDVKLILSDNDTTNHAYFKKPLSSLWNWIKSKLAAVATSGNYNDLTNKPAIPTVDSVLSDTSENPVQNKVVNAALNGKAPIASPAFTGIPTAPTPTSLTENSNRIATLAYIRNLEKNNQTFSNNSNIWSIDGQYFIYGSISGNLDINISNMLPISNGSYVLNRFYLYFLANADSLTITLNFKRTNQTNTLTITGMTVNKYYYVKWVSVTYSSASKRANYKGAWLLTM